MNTRAEHTIQRKLLVALAFVVAAFVVYALALGNPFVIDDHSAIRQHPDVQDTAGVLRLWTHHYWQGSPSLDDQLYRPITVFSYWLSQRVTPGSPAGFRAVNILLLAGIALGVVSWLRRYTGTLPALLMGVLVVTHPANTEAINHIVGRADLLAVLGIVGFLALQAGAQQHGWTRPRVAGAAALAMVALGSKESGLALIPCALAQVWVGSAHTSGIAHNEPRPTGSGPATPEPTSACKTARGICPKRALFLALFLPVALYLAVRLSIVGLPAGYTPAADDLTGNPVRGMGFIDRLPEVFAVAWWYVRQFVWPSTTYNHTPGPDQVGEWNLSVLRGIMTYGFLLAAIIGGSRNRVPALVPSLIFLTYLLIVGHLLTVTGAYAANRLTVPTTVAGAMLVGLTLNAYLHSNTWHRRVIPALVLSAILAFAFLTARANRAWSSELARMNADVEANDEDPVALYWLGQAQLGYDAGAGVSHLKRAYALAPQSNQAAAALADALLATGDDRAAWKLYDELLARNAPLTEPQRANAAMAAFNTGRYGRCRELIRPLPEALARPIREALEQVAPNETE